METRQQSYRYVDEYNVTKPEDMFSGLDNLPKIIELIETDLKSKKKV